MGIRTLVAAGEGTRERVIHILRSAGGYTVVAEAQDGVSAVRLAEQERPDLVVLDVDLAELGGIEATPPIRSRLPDSTIVVLTHSAGGRLAAWAGADRSVSLAAPDTEIVAAVESALPVELLGHAPAGVHRPA